MKLKQAEKEKQYPLAAQLSIAENDLGPTLKAVAYQPCILKWPVWQKLK